MDCLVHGVARTRLSDFDFHFFLLCSTGNPNQDSVITYIGKESEKEQIYVYVYWNHFAVPETNTTL